MLNEERQRNHNHQVDHNEEDGHVGLGTIVNVDDFFASNVEVHDGEEHIQFPHQ